MSDILLFDELDLKQKKCYWKYRKILHNHPPRHNDFKFAYTKTRASQIIRNKN